MLVAGPVTMFFVGLIAYHFGRGRRGQEITQLRSIAAGDMEDMLAQWVLKAGKSTTDGAICRHIAKHTNELFTEVSTLQHRESWAASMRNLLEMYEARHNISQSAELRLGRMMLKYQSDPANHTALPTDLELLPPTTLTVPEGQERERVARKAADKEAQRWAGGS